MMDNPVSCFKGKMYVMLFGALKGMWLGQKKSRKRLPAMRAGERVLQLSSMLRIPQPLRPLFVSVCVFICTQAKNRFCKENSLKIESREFFPYFLALQLF